MIETLVVELVLAAIYAAYYFNKKNGEAIAHINELYNQIDELNAAIEELKPKKRKLGYEKSE